LIIHNPASLVFPRKKAKFYCFIRVIQKSLFPRRGFT
jgi:hypothetical protein